MAIYDYKEFLNPGDIAHYLRDKGVCDFNLDNSYGRYAFTELMENLIGEDKITPVFTFVGLAYDLSDESNRQFLTKKSKCKEAFIFSEKMIHDWRYHREWLELHGVSNPSPFERLNADDYYQYKSFKSHKKYVLDVESNITEASFLVPKIELDNIFNQPTHTEQAKDKQINTLQQQLQEAQTQIKELESTQNMGVNDELHSRTANNSHTNTALIALNDAIATHWQDPNNPPKQQFIQAWIMDNYPSIEPSKALWIDKIIRHQDRK